VYLDDGSSESGREGGRGAVIRERCRMEEYRWRQ
jgi:hypothetical protein